MKPLIFSATKMRTLFFARFTTGKARGQVNGGPCMPIAPTRTTRPLRLRNSESSDSGVSQTAQLCRSGVARTGDSDIEMAEENGRHREVFSLAKSESGIQPEVGHPCSM